MTEKVTRTAYRASKMLYVLVILVFYIEYPFVLLIRKGIHQVFGRYAQNPHIAYVS